MYPYHHTATPQGESLTVFLPGRSPVIVNGDHPHFAEILTGAQGDQDADTLAGLADLSVRVAERFRDLSERVSVSAGRVFFDGDPVDTTLTRQIVRVLDSGAEDWTPLVAFMENAAANPQDHSRAQMYDWLRDRDFSLTPDGGFVGFKGVAKRADGALVSVRSGPAIVNGEPVDGQVPQPLGGTVEIARSTVAHDPGMGCASGLHVGTYDYAKGWAQGALLRVKVNPRDVVSVPTDCNAEKMRVCRYVILDQIDDPDTRPDPAAILYSDDATDAEGPGCWA